MTSTLSVPASWCPDLSRHSAPGPQSPDRLAGSVPRLAPATVFAAAGVVGCASSPTAAAKKGSRPGATSQEWVRCGPASKFQRLPADPMALSIDPHVALRARSSGTAGAGGAGWLCRPWQGCHGTAPDVDRSVLRCQHGDRAGGLITTSRSSTDSTCRKCPNRSAVRFLDTIPKDDSEAGVLVSSPHCRERANPATVSETADRRPGFYYHRVGIAVGVSGGSSGLRPGCGRRGASASLLGGSQDATV